MPAWESDAGLTGPRRPASRAASAGSRSGSVGSSRSATTLPSRSLPGSGESPGRDARYAARHPARFAPTTSAAQSSPTWRIAPGGRYPSASRAAAKIAGCGLIVPTRWLTTTAARSGAHPAASTYRSMVAASGQFERMASRYRGARRESRVEAPGAGGRAATNPRE